MYSDFYDWIDDDPFEDQFYMIFDEAGLPVDTIRFAPIFEKQEEWKIHGGAGPDTVFCSCLSVVDRARFLSLCRHKPSRKNRHKRSTMAIFRLETFYGYPFALAEKNVTVFDDRVYVRFFTHPTRFVDFAAPFYQEYLTTWGRYRVIPTENTATNPVPMPPRCPPFVDLFQLTHRIVTQIRSDPGFYGNQLTLSGDGIRFFHIPEWTDPEKRRYPLYFSSTILASTIYAILTAFADATCTHEMELSLDRVEYDAVFRLKTQINVPQRVGRRTPDAFSEYDIMLLTFAFGLARRGFIDPSYSFSEETRILTITLRVYEPFPREGDFRCNEDPEEGLPFILDDAKTFTALFSGKSIFEEDEEEQI